MVNHVEPAGPLREMRTVYADGAWHFRGGVRRDNIGDFTVGVVQYGDQRWYALMARMGTPPPGGALWYSRYHGGDPAEGWTQGHPPGSRPEPPIKALPGPEGSINIDTHCWVQSPLPPQRLTFVHAVRSGITGLYHLERAVAERLDPSPAAYTRFHYPIVADAGESSIVIDPYQQRAFLFYVRKSVEAPDDYGITFRSRLYRREVDLQDFDTEFRVGPELLVHAPDEAGQGDWGTANGVMQPGICILPGGDYLMARLGRTPFRHPNGEPAVGKMNATTAVGLWLSSDQGKTWRPCAGNPVLSREFFELTDGFADQINSPHPWLDPFANGGRGKLYFSAQVARDGVVNQPGARLMLCELAILP